MENTYPGTEKKNLVTEKQASRNGDTRKHLGIEKQAARNGEKAYRNRKHLPSRNGEQVSRNRKQASKNGEKCL